MRVLALALAFLAPDGGRDMGRGLSVAYPVWWTPVERRLAPCTNPVQRFALRGRGALVVLQESLDPPRIVRRFPPRPRHFTVRGRATPMECCAVRGRPGWMLTFRDSGRAFYAFLYPGRGSVREALTILDSLRVAPRR